MSGYIYLGKKIQTELRERYMTMETSSPLVNIERRLIPDKGADRNTWWNCSVM